MFQECAKVRPPNLTSNTPHHVIIIIIIFIIIIGIIIIIIIIIIIVNNFFFVGIIQHFKILQIIFRLKKLIKANYKPSKMKSLKSFPTGGN